MVLTVFCFNDRTVDSISPPLGYRLAKQGTASAADFQSRRVFAKTSDGTFVVTNLFAIFEILKAKNTMPFENAFSYTPNKWSIVFNGTFIIHTRSIGISGITKTQKKQSFRHPELPVPAKHGLRKRAD